MQHSLVNLSPSNRDTTHALSVVKASAEQRSQWIPTDSSLLAVSAGLSVAACGGGGGGGTNNGSTQIQQKDENGYQLNDDGSLKKDTNGNGRE